MLWPWNRVRCHKIIESRMGKNALHVSYYLVKFLVKQLSWKVFMDQPKIHFSTELHRLNIFNQNVRLEATFINKFTDQPTRMLTFICTRDGGFVEASNDRTWGLLVTARTTLRVKSKLRSLESQLANEQQLGPRQYKHKLASFVIMNPAINTDQLCVHPICTALYI